MTDPILAALGINQPSDTKTPKRKTTPRSDYQPPPEDHDQEAYTLQEKKTKEEVRKLKIGNEKELRNLVERRIVVAILGEVGQSIQNNFVDQAKRNAGTWAAILEIPEKERDIEKLISDLIEDGINGVISDIGKLCDEGIFE